jgi:hypothetical protein
MRARQRAPCQSQTQNPGRQDVPNDPAGSPASFHSRHADGCHFLLMDGSCRFIRASIDLTTFRALCTRNNGEVVPGDFCAAGLAADCRQAVSVMRLHELVYLPDVQRDRLHALCKLDGPKTRRSSGTLCGRSSEGREDVAFVCVLRRSA